MVKELSYKSYSYEIWRKWSIRLCGHFACGLRYSIDKTADLNIIEAFTNFESFPHDSLNPKRLLNFCKPDAYKFEHLKHLDGKTANAFILRDNDSAEGLKDLAPAAVALTASELFQRLHQQVGDVTLK